MREPLRKSMKKHGWRFDLFLHQYVYFVYYKQYNKTARMATAFTGRFFYWFKPLVKGITSFIFNRYHGKLLTVSDTTKLLSLDADLHAVSRENKRIIPYAYSTNIIFEEPRTIVVMDCPCKLASGATCGPVGACMAIGEPIASFWLEKCGNYHPRKITQEEALTLVREFRKTGHYQQIFSKKSSFGQTYALCNCCKHCCSAHKATMLAHTADKNLSQSAPSGYTVVCNETKCTGCGKCADICSFYCITINGKERTYDKSGCLGCELCVEHCPTGALSLVFDESKNILPFDVDIIRRDFAGKDQ